MFVAVGLARLFPAHFMSTDSHQASTTVSEKLDSLETRISFAHLESKFGIPASQVVPVAAWRSGRELSPGSVG